MDQWTRIGWVLVMVGIFLLASSVSMSRVEVEARETVATNTGEQIVGPVHLDRGSVTVWLEEHYTWHWDLEEFRVILLQEDERYTGEVPKETTWRDIEGVRCFMVALFPGITEGDYEVALELFDWMGVDSSDEVALFVLTSRGPMVTMGLAAGTVMTVLGVAAVTRKHWPSRAPPRHRDGDE